MKLFSVTIFLAAGRVIAAPTELNSINGVIPGGPPGAPSKRDDGNKGQGVGFGSCNADPVFRDLRKDNNAAGASAFCSSYIRPTATVSTTVSVPTTSTVIKYSTTSTTTTITSIVTGTSTVTCAAQPTAPTTCGFDAYGFGQFLISQNSGVDPIDCHERCLADINCQSFQVQNGGAMFCNLYNVVTAGNVVPAPGGGFTFYDRDCPDLLPVQCTRAPAKQKRQNPAVPTPSYFATVPPSHISSACSCFITASLAPSTTTVTQQTTIPTTITATSITTDVRTEVTGTTTTSYAIVTAPP
ncbi:hypothetical protein GJ744_002792 [Endocarpon pusillum]|uniref:Apple domain-containing protein n=1 Tax=Endocarpon pusillum TaxID=364733 RepID=A0A8H7E6B4_9EURO|nr:hypothetical protein GJ744_002792 [Endocarpon pusillum]